MEIRKSERKQAKIKLALQGSAGSGKTYSSLLLAKEQAEEIEDLKRQIEQLKGKNQELKRAKINNQATQITAGGLGMVAGFLLKR